MKYGHKEISELLDIEIVQAYQNCLHAEHKRATASLHFKFDKVNNKKAMEFPDINPAFIELKDELAREMKKRKLEIEP